MEIKQVICNGITLQIGDKITVKYKEILDNHEEGNTITKNITIDKFKPFDDSSGDIWIVGNDGQLYADENFIKKIQ